MRFFLVLSILSLLSYSCGSNSSDESTGNPSAVSDSTETPQIKEFREVNTQLKANINNPSLYLKRAKLYVKYNDLGMAIADVDRALKLDSLSPEYYLLKADLYKKQDNLKASKEALDACMIVDNNNITARIELAWLALITRDYKQAIKYADAVLKRDLHNADAYYLKGMVFEEQKDTVLAISTFSTCVEQENDYYDAYVHLGLLNFDKDLSLAKGYFKNALRIQPKSMEALYAYALACQENGDYNESIETYYAILDIEQYREPYFNLGFIHQEYLKVYDVAVDHYTKAIEVEPKYLEAYYNRGLCYEKMDQKAKAETDYRYTLKLNPQYTSAAIALERVLN